MKFVHVDVGSWIQGAGDGKEARWTEQLVNLLRQIAVAVENGYDGLQVTAHLDNSVSAVFLSRKIASASSIKILAT